MGGGEVTGLLLAILAWAGQEPSVVVTDCDCVELNHLHDAEGRHVFTQWIWWDYKADGRHEVVGWRLDKGQMRGTPCEFVFHDGDVMRRVRTKYYMESFTQHDPELVNRDLLPKEMRRELAGGEARVPARLSRKVTR